MTDTHTAAGPLFLGLTGGIGAGKSTVAALCADRGAGIIDADRIAREVVEPGEPALAALRDAFGEEVLTPGGALDRPALAGLAFASPEQTAVLNRIMHPAIEARTAQRLKDLADRPIVVHDIPLLVENGLTGNYHLSLLVDVPEEIRLERLTTLRGLEREDAIRRIRAQATDAQRLRACDVRLDNAGARDRLEEQFAAVWDARIEPFRRNREAGVPAEPLPLTAEDASAEAQAAAGDRLVSRLERAARRAGLTVTAAAAVSPAGVAIDLHAPEGSESARIHAVLRDAGYAQGGGTGLYLSADPGRPATVALTGA